MVQGKEIGVLIVCECILGGMVAVSIFIATQPPVFSNVSNGMMVVAAIIIAAVLNVALYHDVRRHAQIAKEGFPEWAAVARDILAWKRAAAVPETMPVAERPVMLQRISALLQRELKARRWLSQRQLTGTELYQALQTELPEIRRVIRYLRALPDG